MGIIKDRRPNGTKNAQTNRQRFLKRVRKQIKQAMPDIIEKGSIKELTSGKKDIQIPIKSTKQPSFKHRPDTGKRNVTQPGNDRWRRGDTYPKPPRGGGQGGSGNGKGADPNGSDTEDEFSVHISREEFLEYFFDDLRLPNMVKQFFKRVKKPEWHRRGLSPDGIMARLNLGRSMTQAYGRRIAVERGLQKRIAELESELVGADADRAESIQTELTVLRDRQQNIPFLDDIDLKFNRLEKVEKPVNAAVMFCVMDVSSSMGPHEKDLAKRFFTLLYLFLTKEYEDVQLVFIRHTTTADEVDEDTFFDDRKTGGTYVTPALQLTKQIMEQRYGQYWNIYVAQVSDGDTWGGSGQDSDAAVCARTMESMRPLMQAAFYVEISNKWYDGAEGNYESDLWQAYAALDWLNTAKIMEIEDIWPVFRELFKRQSAE